VELWTVHTYDKTEILKTKAPRVDHCGFPDFTRNKHGGNYLLVKYLGNQLTYPEESPKLLMQKAVHFWNTHRMI
jgi:hypothetical protein